MLFNSKKERESFDSPKEEKIITKEEHKVSYETNKSVISKSTKIIGEVHSDETLEINGTVIGNVTTSDDLYLNGSVDGFIKSNDVRMNGCKLNGDINAKGNVVISSNTNMHGNIIAKNLELDGIVNGNIKVSEALTILSNGAVIGDIESATISIAQGASVEGRVQVGKSPKVEKPSSDHSDYSAF